MNLVDEQNPLRVADHRLDDGLQALLEVAAKARTGQQRAHIERVDLDALERVGHVALMNCERESLGERGLADSSLADEHGIVLAPAQQHVHRALEFLLAADQRIDFAVSGALGQIDCVGVERLGRRQLALAVFVAAFMLVAVAIDRILVGLVGVLVVFGARLRDSVRDEIDHVEAGDALFLEKENRRAIRIHGTSRPARCRR